MILAKRKREADFLRDKMLVEAALVAQSKGEGLDEAYKEYRSALFPFLESESKKLEDRNRSLLKHWVGKKAFKVQALWRPEDSKGLMSRLRRGAEKVKQSEEHRRRVPHKRI
jgi:hypothetical protein